MSESGKEFSGLLEITSVLQDEKVLITFADNGVGIPEENRSKVFDPFFSTARQVREQDWG